MSVLIKGMGFPTKENFMTRLYSICDKDGDWYAVDTTNKDLYKLIEVKEPHGRLIDADTLEETLTVAIRIMEGLAKFLRIENDPEIKMAIKAYTDILNGVKEQLTIIEAEKEE